jgi:elongation factor 1-alpha
MNPLTPENEEDNVEYKRHILDSSENNIIKLGSQILRRINAEKNIDGYSYGECKYYIGIDDDGTLGNCTEEQYKISIGILDQILKRINCIRITLDERRYSEGDSEGHVGEFLLRENNTSNPMEIFVLVGGSVDSAKSSTIGCLISGEPDNGRGKSRLLVLSNKDEIRTGRTMSISHQIMGLDPKGNPIRNINYTWADIVNNSKKIIKFIDLAGHQKYSKTTLKGYTLMKANVCCILVGANMGVNIITKEHIFLCVNLRIPFCFIVSKIDLCKNRENVIKETIDELKRLMNLASIRKSVYIIEDNQDVISCAKNIYSLNVVPLFKISNITFEGMDNLISFFNLIPYKKFDVGKTIKGHETEKGKNKNDPVEFFIDSTFRKKGFSLILGGMLNNGQVSINDRLYLGPDKNGKFYNCTVKGIHYNKCPIESTFNNSYYCFAIKKDKNDLTDFKGIRRGMVLLSENPVCYNKFLAKVHVHQIKRKTNEKSTEKDISNSHTTTIRVNYEPTIHLMNIRENCKIMEITNKISKRNEAGDSLNNILTAGDIAHVLFRFKFKPHYIKVGEKILLTEGNIKAIGEILEIYE